MSNRIDAEKSTSEEGSAVGYSPTDSSPDLLFALSIIDTVREPLLVLNHDLRVHTANNSFYSTFQVSAEETEGRNIFTLGEGQWDLPELRSLLQTVITVNRTVEDFEVDTEFPRLGRKVMLLNARQIHLRPGPGTSANPHLVEPRVLLAMEDITARRTAELAVRIYVQKLEASNRELQDFAYIASHDLQEPLRAIQAFGERLAVKYGDKLDDQGRDYLFRMERAAGRMRVLIHDLLEYSRVTTKAKPFAPVDLEEVVYGAVNDLSKRLDESGGKVEVGKLPSLEGDASQMRQLFQNLLGNALKFQRAGVQPMIHVRSERVPSAGGMLSIEVSDNGIGFEQRYVDRVFNPFQRLHSQSKYEGNGIGLAICRKIVERHHGTISAVSAPGEGATFLVKLPEKQPEEIAVTVAITSA